MVNQKNDYFLNKKRSFLFLVGINMFNAFVIRYILTMIPRGWSKRGLGRFGARLSTSLPANGKPPPRAPFEPTQHGLDGNFVLTNFTKMKG